MFLVYFIELCDHLHYLISECFQYPRRSPVPISSHSPFPAPSHSLATTNLLPVYTVLPILDI